MNRISWMMREEKKRNNTETVIPTSTREIEQSLVQVEHARMEQIRHNNRVKLGLV